MNGIVLVTGASGNVGNEVVKQLVARGQRVRAATRTASSLPFAAHGIDTCAFDFTDPATFGPALAGVDRVFLVRPPHMAKAAAFEPFLSAMHEARVGHVVFLSLLGVERNPIVPHHGIEKRLKGSGLGWTMIRPGFYMQNLSTTHLADIRDHGVISVPAGNGRTSLIDVRDIAEAVAVVLSENGHLNRGYAVTGREAITYQDAARILSQVTGREIRYTAPSGAQFARHMAAAGHPRDFITVMRGIYLVAKLGMAGTVTQELPRLIGRPAITFEQFARDNAALFGSPASAVPASA
ncbi:MAG: SDR family oxidoreductase [Coriobacteriia bacterium]|nr:SDR family oxidoreductase [Coriobacteriia bacterium]